MNPPRSVAIAVLVVTCLTSCGPDDGKGEGPAPTVSPGPDGEEVVITTQMVGFDGTVLTGSVLDGAPFCTGGTVRHEHGSQEIGFPAVNVLDCPGGSLRIGFGPGPDQMELTVQTSDWRVLEGTGAFAGTTGEGTMRVRFQEGDPPTAHETFRGVLVVR